MSRRTKDGLSDEDQALWQEVARTIKRVDLRQRVSRSAPETPQRLMAPVASRPNAKLPPPPAPVPAKPAPATIEARKAKRVAKGRDQIEARIDLHGMRQTEAHGALRGFLLRAHDNGLRMVLVITGKGKASDANSDAPFDMFDNKERGVLRRNVPRWLVEPELRVIVVGYTTAHAKHGGDGAFYVQLRNRDKHRG